MGVNSHPFHLPGSALARMQIQYGKEVWIILVQSVKKISDEKLLTNSKKRTKVRNNKQN